MFVCGYLVLLVVVATCFCSVYGGGLRIFCSLSTMLHLISIFSNLYVLLYFFMFF